MTQAKHTLEQWRIKLAITGPAKSKLEETGIIGTQAKDAIVKVLNLDFEDANLISAAPELLEALRMWLDIHDTPAGFAGKYGKAFDAALAAQQLKVDAAASAARAAIAKSTGGAA